MRIMPRCSRYAALLGERNGNVAKSILRGDAAQIAFQQGREMRRIITLLKSIELVLYQECQLAQQAKLVGRGHNDPATRVCQAHQFSNKGTRILQMLDGLDG